MEVSLQEAAALLKNANDIVIKAHENPDGDAVGSTLGLMHILCDMGKKVQVMIDDDIPSNLFVLKGADGIVRPMERDAGILVVLDTSLDRIGEVEKLVHAGKVLNLDHHRTNDMEAENVYVDSDSAATCEIVYRLASYLLPPVSDSEGDGLTAGCRLSSAMSKAAAMLEKFGIDYEMTIISAHREPDVFFDWAKSAEGKGIKVIIAGAGMAAHLPGMCAALFPMPVIGVPMSGKNLAGEDALFSIVQMPPGIPVATVAIDGGMNAAILAAKILAVSDPELLDQLKAYTKEMKETVQGKAARLDEIGYEAYLAQK